MKNVNVHNKMKNVNVHYLFLSETYEPVARVKIIDNERPGAGPCDLLLVIVRVL